MKVIIRKKFTQPRQKEKVMMKRLMLLLALVGIVAVQSNVLNAKQVKAVDIACNDTQDTDDAAE